MIVLDRGSRWLLVLQPDHAALGACAAAALRRPAAIPAAVWPRFVEAVRRHDDGWVEEERQPDIDPRGRPFDFMTLPGGRHVDVWRRSAEKAERADPYAGLLVANHGMRLYGRASAGPARVGTRASDFDGEMRAAIERRRSALLGGSPDEGAAAQPDAVALACRLLGFFDGLSLALLGAVPLSAASEPIGFGDERGAVTLSREAPGAVRVEPWPFAAPALSLDACAAAVDARPYSSPAELARAMAAAPIETLRFEIRR